MIDKHQGDKDGNFFIPIMNIVKSNINEKIISMMD